MSKYASTLLSCFIRTAELGSFAAAARALDISSAAVGQNIKRLEDAHGIKLFNRTTRKMSLTPDGALLFQRAREPLRELDELDRLFDESRGVVSGQLRVTSPKRLARKRIIPLIAEFRNLYPAIEIDLDASDAVRDFVEDPVDVAFRLGEPTESTMIARHLSDLPVFFLGAPDYFDTHGRPSHPQDLEAHRCIRYRSPTDQSLWPWTVSIEGNLQRLDPGGELVFNDPEVICAAGIAGLGLIHMDGQYVQEHIEAGELEPVMPEFVPNVRSLYMCYSSRDNLPLRVRTFIDFAVSRFPKNVYAATTP